MAADIRANQLYYDEKTRDKRGKVIAFKSEAVFRDSAFGASVFPSAMHDTFLGTLTPDFA